MIQMYMQKNFAQETNPDLEAFMIHGAMNYFNRKFQTNLTMNHNSDGNYVGSDVKDILSSAAILDINPKLKKRDVMVVDDDVKLWSKKFTGNMDAVKCSEGCGGFCYCPAVMELRMAYSGANIYFIFTVKGSQCFLCEKNFKEGTLNAHFNKNCPAFGRPRSTTNN
ncbi:hypothetical protein Bhyg_00484 [Pseudolycoriella hygida]|uniref:Uncharacterized protein n=1 Tax=Pseudolycoriella hygida TaxID=35572 RepID=A0A9Q0S6M0_9DIPT|nr:hypothetical protein Bhyg_00484 [Pseudolycoriella hygida]